MWMGDLVKRALTRRIRRRGLRGNQHVIVQEPNENIVLLVKFSLAMTGCLSALQVAHLAVTGRWNSEIFAAITGLIGTVTGVLIGHHF